MTNPKPQLISRRQILSKAAQLSLLSMVAPVIWAKPEDQAQAIQKAFGEAPIQQGRVNIVMPTLAENGNSVRMTIDVDSPMSEQDYVESIHVFSEANPLPNVASYFFTPDSGKASIEGRIRLNDSQHITAIAKMSDGSLWMDSTAITVTIAACVNPWL